MVATKYKRRMRDIEWPNSEKDTESFITSFFVGVVLFWVIQFGTIYQDTIEIEIGSCKPEFFSSSWKKHSKKSVE